MISECLTFAVRLLFLLKQLDRNICSVISCEWKFKLRKERMLKAWQS